MNSPLQMQLDFKKAYRNQRLSAATWVLAHPNSFKELLTYCFDPSENEQAHKANWVLEFVVLEDKKMLYPHLDYFFEHLSRITKDQSLRPLAHICELLSTAYYQRNDLDLQSLVTAEHKDIMIQCCFDWLMTNKKVACEVRAMTSLYYLGTEFHWIHPELSEIISRNMSKKSAGYKARGSKILEKIAKARSVQ